MSVGLSAIAITTRWTLLSIACRQTGHSQLIHPTPHRVSVIELSSSQTNSTPSTVTQTNELQWQRISHTIGTTIYGRPVPYRLLEAILVYGTVRSPWPVDHRWIPFLPFMRVVHKKATTM